MIRYLQTLSPTWAPLSYILFPAASICITYTYPYMHTWGFADPNFTTSTKPFKIRAPAASRAGWFFLSHHGLHFELQYTSPHAVNCAHACCVPSFQPDSLSSACRPFLRAVFPADPYHTNGLFSTTLTIIAFPLQQAHICMQCTHLPNLPVSGLVFFWSIVKHYLSAMAILSTPLLMLQCRSMGIGLG